MMASTAAKPNPVANTESIVHGDHYRFTFLNEYVTRFEWAEDGVFEDRASTMVVNRYFPKPEFTVYDSQKRLEVETPMFRLTYDKKRFSSSGLIIVAKSKLTLWGAEWHYGCVPERNLGGTARTLDEVNGRCDMGIGLLSRAGYSALDDSSSMLFDGKGFVAPRRSGDRIDGYFFSYGLDFKGVMKAYYELSGFPPVIPRWALGNWWSRYYAYTQEEYLGLMDKFKSRRIPLSVAVIDMDWHLVSDDRVPHAGWTGYTWNDKLFPDPPRFGRELQKRNLKITLNEHPHAGIHHHEDAYEDMSRALGRLHQEKQPIEFDPTDPEFMKAYFDVLQRSIRSVVPVSFIWIDWQQGGSSKMLGIDPLWVLNHFHFLDSVKVNDQDGLIFSRYAGPGSQRYPVGFSGDTIATWESLKFQPEFTAVASNIGYGWWSHDLGGHMLGYRNDEMVARWIQFGVFSPIFRLHSSNSRWTSKEPWLYRKEAEQTIEESMRFRHRLVPYLYNMNLRAAEGEPLVQPMYWTHPHAEEAYEVPNQYLFGSELICAPITEPRNTTTNLASTTVWVPPGKHVDIFTGTVYEGGRKIQMYRPLHQVPVLAAEGSIIPLDAELAPENGCPNPKAFEILIVVGASSKFSIVENVEDDSVATHHDGGKVSNTRISTIEFDQDSGTLKANLQAGTWTFRFLGLDNKRIRETLDDKDHANLSVAHASYPDPVATSVTVSNVKAEYKFDITLDGRPQLTMQDHKERIGEMISDFQIEFALKDEIWKIVNHQYSAGMKAAGLMALRLPEYIVEPLVELLCASG